MTMINKLKPTNKNVIVNVSDSGKEVEECSCFLKGGAFVSLWNIISIMWMQNARMSKNMVGRMQSC